MFTLLGQVVQQMLEGDTVAPQPAPPPAELERGATVSPSASASASPSGSESESGSDDDETPPPPLRTDDVELWTELWSPVVAHGRSHVEAQVRLLHEMTSFARGAQLAHWRADVLVETPARAAVLAGCRTARESFLASLYVHHKNGADSLCAAHKLIATDNGAVVEPLWFGVCDKIVSAGATDAPTTAGALAQYMLRLAVHTPSASLIDLAHTAIAVKLPQECVALSASDYEWCSAVLELLDAVAVRYFGAARASCHARLVAHLLTHEDRVPRTRSVRVPMQCVDGALVPDRAALEQLQLLARPCWLHAVDVHVRHAPPDAHCFGAPLATGVRTTLLHEPGGASTPLWALYAGAPAAMKALRASRDTRTVHTTVLLLLAGACDADAETLPHRWLAWRDRGAELLERAERAQAAHYYDCLGRLALECTAGVEAEAVLHITRL